MTDYKLNLIRHGMTAGNIFGLYIGTTDISLCDEGRAQLEKLTQDLEYPSVHKVYTSPLKRCVQSAELIYPDRWIQEIPELRECNFGVFEARMFSELKNDPEYIRWMEDASQAPPKGESALEVSRRADRAVDLILEDMMHQRINRAAVVTHGGIIAMLLAAHGFPRRSIREWPVDFGRGWCVSVNPQRWRTDRVFEVLSEVPDEFGGDDNG